MNTLMLLDMAVSGFGDRVALGSRRNGITYARLRAAAAVGAKLIREGGRRTVVFVGENGPAFPVAMFAAAAANVPFLPLNYRLAPEAIADALSKQDAPLLIAGDKIAALAGEEVTSVPLADWPARCLAETDLDLPVEFADADDVAVLLQTSGTTSAPKSAVLRHRHLASYALGTVEFGSAGTDEATLVAVPPYHIAAVANLLTNLYAGRRIVYLDAFSAAGWLDIVREEGITHTMVVPTMLARIVDELERTGESAPGSLRSLSYGGAKMPRPVIEKALKLFPSTDFVNAYGLTETSSSIAVLFPEDHRQAAASEDPAVRARLGSVGRPLPGITIEIRDDRGEVCPPNFPGEIWVRGAQVAGEYLESGTLLDADGWFATRDHGHVDEEGYLFVGGRSDDTIIRGGENIAPAEVEDVILDHPAVAEVAVAGVDDDEWGHRIVAFVVTKSGQPVDPEDIREWVRARLRSSRTPDEVLFLSELPQTATGKILRRELVKLAAG